MGQANSSYSSLTLLRQGTETDLPEVLQTDRIFNNVSKGEFAKSSALKKSFYGAKQEDIAHLIMRGDLQESNMERLNRIESSALEIASLITSKCVNPTTTRPYSVRIIREAIKKAEFNLNERKTVKQLFLECAKLIKAKGFLPLERENMELCAVFQEEQEIILLELKSKDLELLKYEPDIPLF